MRDHLEESYLDELFKCCLMKKDFLHTVMSHMKTTYIPERHYQEIWKEMVRHLRVEDKPPSIGVLSQKFRQEENHLDAIGNIKQIVKPDFEGVLAGFEEFIRQNKFVEFYDNIGDTYNEGNKEKAYNDFKLGAEELHNFSLKEALHTKIFKGFPQRFTERLLNLDDNKKIPFGIGLLDYYTFGGGERGDTALFLGDSGVGKSQLLINCGISAARYGFKVAHFQAEGTKRQVNDRYDANWTGTLYRDMKISNMEEKKLDAMLRKIKKMNRGEIYVEANEKFEAWTLVEVRQSLIQMIKLYGNIDLVLLDYLELFEPGDGRNYPPSEERFRQQSIGKLLKNLAMEFNILLITATQASAVPPQAKEEPDFVMTRWNLSEDKGKLRPFDMFITINQTADEKKSQRVRLYCDKLREYASGQVIPIMQNLEKARFYDRKRTIEEIYAVDEDFEDIVKFV